MRNSKVLSFLTAGAIALSSFAGIIPGETAVAYSSPKQRWSSGMFYEVVSSGQGAGVLVQNTSATFLADTYEKIFYTTSNFRGAAQAEVMTTSNNAMTVTTLGKNQPNRIANNEVFAVWHDGIVGDLAGNNVIDAVDDVIVLNVVSNSNTGFLAATNVGIGKTKDTAPNLLVSANVINANGTKWAKTTEVDGIYIAAAAGANGDRIGVSLDPKAAHYIKKTAYLYAGESSTNDDGQYLPITVAYPDALLVGAAHGRVEEQTADSFKTLNATGSNSVYGLLLDGTNQAVDHSSVPYGGERTYWVNHVLTDALPLDNWDIELKDNTAGIEIVKKGDDGKGHFYFVLGATTDKAVKGNSAKLRLFNSRVKDENLVFEYTVKVTAPNFYEQIYIRDKKDDSEHGTDYADGTYTTSELKAELHATAVQTTNEGTATIARNQVRWTWEAADEATKKLMTDKTLKVSVPADANSDIATFQVDAIPEGGIVGNFIVKAFSANAGGNFDQNNNGTGNSLFGSRTLTVKFTTTAPTPEPEPEPEPTPVVDGQEYVTDNGSIVTVASAASKEVVLTGFAVTSSDVVIPSTVKINGTDYTVVGLGKQIFKGQSFKSVTIPGTVTVVGQGAFKKCKKLQTVTLNGTAGSLTTLKNAFKKTSSKLTIVNSSVLDAASQKQVKKDNGSVKLK